MKLRFRIPFLIVSLIFAASTVASERPARDDDLDVEIVGLDTRRMESFLATEAKRVGQEAWQRIDSPEKLRKEKDRLHREFMFMIGLDPLPPRTPLQLTHVRTVEREGFTIDVLHYQSLPGFYVTANLYRPTSGGPFPAVVWGPGHSADLYGAKALRQNYAIPWVRNGYICLVIDPIQVAEVFGVHRGTHSWEMRDWYARGYSPIGIEVWNAMRGVDYLLSRSDVDGERITINGVSGGGHLSWMAGAADPRITVVQPVAGTSDVYTHVTEDLQRSHCDCAYFINLYRHDWPTLAALIAPRPFKMHHSTNDHYYPQSGYLAVMEKSKALYEMLGVPEKVSMFEVPGRHGYNQAQREKAVEWSNHWLKGDDSRVTEKSFEETPRDQLAALGGMKAKHPPNINSKIQEMLIPAAALEEFDDAEAWRAKRRDVLDQLKSYVFRNMPSKVTWKIKSTGENRRVSLETEPNIQIGVASSIPGSITKDQGAVLLVASDGDTLDAGIWQFMRAYPYPGYAASRHMVYPRGTGRSLWNRVQQRKYERLSMVIGRTLDDQRLYDVLCAVDYICELRELDGGDVTIVGRGEAGILGAYAALFDERITRVVLRHPPTSHRAGPIFLNVLRYTDVPQILAMLAPDTDLVFLNDPSPPFDLTRQTYGLLGAEHKFSRGHTVTDVLNRR